MTKFNNKYAQSEIVILKTNKDKNQSLKYLDENQKNLLENKFIYALE